MGLVARASRWQLGLGLAVLVILGSALHLWAADRFFGDDQGHIELRVEKDGERTIFLQAYRFNEHGEYMQLLHPVRLFNVAGHPETYREEAGVLPQAEQPVMVRFDQRHASLQWLQPRRLAMPDGTLVELAGSHALLSEEVRLALAEARFRIADGRLNELYRLLRAGRAPEWFADLRHNQRRWLKQRDHFIADGDDYHLNGPGTTAFIREQTRRTRQRILFLEALAQPASAVSANGSRFGDGLGWELRLAPVVDGRSFFDLRGAHHHNNGDKLQLPPLLCGPAAREGNDGWVLRGTGVGGKGSSGEHEPLTLIVDGGGGLLYRIDDPSWSLRLYRLGELSPAQLPLPHLLLRLPPEAFDDATEGMNHAEKIALLERGESTFYRLEEQGADYLRVGYRDGAIDIRRYPGADGGAVLAVTISNVRARTFQLWRFSPQHETPRLWPLDQALPQPSRGDHSPHGETAIPEFLGRAEYFLFPEQEEIELMWADTADALPNVVSVRLLWDGGRFIAVGTTYDN
jgi:uncharacterized protein YecT (DUF1311 family)